MVQPCFEKLWEFMQSNLACEEACEAVQKAASWQELCSHPLAGYWAVWAWQKFDKKACEQARQTYKQACEQAWQAAIAVVRKHFEEPQTNA